jgi:transposase InsO family protein
MIDQYSKYPEVDVLKSTTFTKLQPVLDRIFATHGIPETLTTDNGPPYSSHDMSEYAKYMGFELTPVTPEDLQSNGFA